MVYILYVLYVLCLLLPCAAAAEEPEPKPLTLSTPEQLAHQDRLVGKLVGPLGGQLILKQTDLQVAGAEPLTLERFYIAPAIQSSYHRNGGNADRHHMYMHLASCYKGWVLVPHIRLEKQPGNVFRITDRHGATLDYRLVNGQTKLVSNSAGISNFAGHHPSGQYDPRNTQITDLGAQVIVKASDGLISTYRLQHSVYLLEKEQLPNGKIRHYSTTATDPYLAQIRTTDPSEQFTYATLSMVNFASEDRVVKSSTGQQVDYHYYRCAPTNKWREGTKRNFKSQIASPFILSSVQRPLLALETMSYDERFLLQSYRADDVVCHCDYGYANHGYANVKTLTVGDQSTRQATHRLDYEMPQAGQHGGITKVDQADGTRILYHYNKQCLPERIAFYNASQQLCKQTVYEWTSDQRLNAMAWSDAAGNPVCRKSYEYDRFGNPVKETLAGDLTGWGGVDTIAIKRIFSDDGLHLLLREESEAGKVVTYQYVPNTHLPKRKLTYDKDLLISTETWEYDAQYNLIENRVDDGVTCQVTSHKLRQQQPFLHMPEWTTESYIEAGNEHILKRTHYTYDTYGNICQEQIYGSDSELAYTLHRTYNEAGQKVAETDALGHHTTYSYDDHGHCISSWNMATDVRKTWRYDTLGRLLEECEGGADGPQHKTLYAYDGMDRLIAKTDPFGNVTRYTYDLISNRVTVTESPAGIALNDAAIPVITRSEYDVFGRKTKQIDANGNITIYRSNCYGSPIEITHPNGRVESFRYTKSGKLQSHTDLAGLTVSYTYDGLERIVAKTYRSSNQDLGTELFAYQGNQLVSETDRAGNVTAYRYDSAGRKISEEFAGHRTDYSYDALGRTCRVTQQNGDATRVTSFTRDLLDRVLETTKSGLDGSVLLRLTHTYDAAGNEITTTRYPDNQPSTTSKTYDAFNRYTSETDPLGHCITTQYDESHTNALMQRILTITTTDPSGVMTIVTHDASGNEVKRETRSPTLGTVACQEKAYDAAGNLIERREHIYVQNEYQRTQVITYAFNNQNRVSRMIRAANTADARTTAYGYTAAGEVERKTLPSGLTLDYRYDAFGHMTSLRSSDGQLSLAYTYDRLGRLTQAVDVIKDLTIDRTVDPHGNVLAESFPMGLTLTKSYDALNRPLHVSWSDDDVIEYTYDALHLRLVNRSGQYVHHYTNYDADGHVLSESPIAGHPAITHHYDGKGRQTSVSSAAFAQDCEYDALDNLVRTTTPHESTYTYDALGQLQSERSATTSHHYTHDSHYNRIATDNDTSQVNPLDELLNLGVTVCTYDLNGNIITKSTPTQTWHYSYDPLNQLTSATSDTQRIDYTYDPLGRRLSKVVDLDGIESDRQHYLYDGDNEIAAFSPHGNLQQLRVLGHAKYKNVPATVAIEIDGAAYVPFLDCQGHIRHLTSAITGQPFESYAFDAFGREPVTRHLNPWRYASKRCDPETQLIYFGKRYYDPQLGRWLTTDPAGFLDTTNLYAYVRNNPFRYVDPDGRFAVAIQLLVWGCTGVSIALPSITTLITSVVAGAATWYGAELTLKYFSRCNAAHNLDHTIQKNTNPFAGAVDEDVIIVDDDGNAIDVPAGNWLTGSRNGKWIQEMQPGGTQGVPTGKRKDGGGHPPPKHTDSRANDPHGHVPGVTNPDGTDWLPIKH